MLAKANWQNPASRQSLRDLEMTFFKLKKKNKSKKSKKLPFHVQTKGRRRLHRATPSVCRQTSALSPNNCHEFTIWLGGGWRMGGEVMRSHWCFWSSLRGDKWSSLDWDSLYRGVRLGRGATAVRKTAPFFFFFFQAALTE